VINATEDAVLRNQIVSVSAPGARPGDISITAGESVQFSGSRATADARPGGSGGTILIDAGKTFSSTDSLVTANSLRFGTQSSGNGGNITIRASDLRQMRGTTLARMPADQGPGAESFFPVKLLA
jgi:hypothetical protein